MDEKKESEKDIEFKIPKEADNFSGEFVVFFSGEYNPKILFHSLIPEEAYREANKIKENRGEMPVVLRVGEAQNRQVQFLARHVKP